MAIGISVFLQTYFQPVPKQGGRFEKIGSFLHKIGSKLYDFEPIIQ